MSTFQRGHATHWSFFSLPFSLLSHSTIFSDDTANDLSHFIVCRVAHAAHRFQMVESVNV